MKLKDMNQSPELLELRPVNGVTVSRYRQAMRQGAKFPPLKWDEVHRIIVGGNHRVAAMTEEFGEEYEPEFETLHLETWADVLEEFALDNATHGKPLEGYSRRKTALALLDAGRALENVARLFDVSAGRVEKWGEDMVRVIGKRGKQTSKPTKFGVPKNAEPITEKEYSKHAKLERGVTVRHMAEQITNYAHRGWLRLDDDREMQALESLRDALAEVLG